MSELATQPVAKGRHVHRELGIATIGAATDDEAGLLGTEPAAQNRQEIVGIPALMTGDAIQAPNHQGRIVLRARFDHEAGRSLTDVGIGSVGIVEGFHSGWKGDRVVPAMETRCSAVEGLEWHTFVQFWSAGNVLLC